MFFIQHLVLERLVAGVQKSAPMAWQSLGNGWQAVLLLLRRGRVLRRRVWHVVWQSLDQHAVEKTARAATLIACTASAH